ncbi:polyamine-modulated factor 1 isoform X2 [Moschus berezovskii]|uniref:polyamine-modulated factor 1 isoform X2 n=1 Tax=Moschus berezovskii TaxID=68408 RepID=UPI002443EB70|nr:polyamine-modulated factor 1 isoform X2 [Moschus berezovskii]
MAEASSVNVGSSCEEKGPKELSQESARPGTIISRVKLFDTMVDTFLQKLVAAGSFQRFTDCYKCFYQLQPEMTQRIYDKFVTQLQTSIQEEISEIKAEGNLEAVLIALDAIVEESKDRKEPAWSIYYPPRTVLHARGLAVTKTRKTCCPGAVIPGADPLPGCLGQEGEGPLGTGVQNRGHRNHKWPELLPPFSA